MNWKMVAMMVALASAAPAVAREAESGGNGENEIGRRGRGGDDGPGDDRGGDDAGGDDHGGSGGGGSGGGSWTRSRAYLVRAAGASDADVRGHVEIRTRDGRERIQVEAERLDAGAAVEFFVADGAGVPVSLGSLSADLLGEAEMEIDTGDGGVLPGGAAKASDLSGRAVEVRDAAGGLLLTGTVPSLNGAGSKRSGRARVRDDASGVRVKVELRSRSGREEFRFEVRKAAPAAAVTLRIADAAGTPVEAAATTADGEGNARLRLDSRRGDALPLGVSSVVELSGRAFEVRVDGVTTASGLLPTL